MSVSLSQGLMLGQVLAVLSMSPSSCRAAATACGRALASPDRKAMGSPVAFSADNLLLQADESAFTLTEMKLLHLPDQSSAER